MTFCRKKKTRCFVSQISAQQHAHARDCDNAGAGITAERELIWARRQQLRPIAGDDSGQDKAPSGQRGGRSLLGVTPNETKVRESAFFPTPSERSIAGKPAPSDLIYAEKRNNSHRSQREDKPERKVTHLPLLNISRALYSFHFGNFLCFKKTNTLAQIITLQLPDGAGSRHLTTTL